MTEELLTLEEVADILKVRVRTVKTYIQEEKLPAVKLSYKVVRVKKTELDDYINKKGEGE